MGSCLIPTSSQNINVSAGQKFQSIFFVVINKRFIFADRLDE